jgi:hypothetical protein
MPLTRPCLAAVLLATLSSATLAFQPLITDDTGTQGQGGKQIEVSYGDQQTSLAGDTTRTRTLPLVYTWGASDTLDVYLGIVPTQIRSSIPGVDTGGLGNTALGAKWRFWESADSGTSLAVKPEIRLPVSTSQEAAGLGSGMTSYGLTLILTQELPFGAIHVNLAKGRDLFLDPETRPHASTLRASMAPVWNVSEQWKLTLDLGRESVSAMGDTTWMQFMQVGAVYSPNKDLDLSLGVLRNTDDATPQTTSTTATVGLTWRFR